MEEIDGNCERDKCGMAAHSFFYKTDMPAHWKIYPALGWFEARYHWLLLAAELDCNSIHTFTHDKLPLNWIRLSLN